MTDEERKAKNREKSRKWRADHPGYGDGNRSEASKQRRREHHAAYMRKWSKDHPQYYSERMAKWRAENPEKTKQHQKNYYNSLSPEQKAIEWRRNDLRRKYGITPEQYDEMLKNQAGTCWICEQPPKEKRLAVDHNHETGALRALLCKDCNVLLHKLENIPLWLSNATEYLDLFRDEPARPKFVGSRERVRKKVCASLKNESNTTIALKV